MDTFYIDIENFKLKIEYRERKIVSVEFCESIGRKASSEIEYGIEKVLRDYILGKAKSITLDFDMDGSDFEKRVWNELLKIPYGKTLSYGEIAKRIGNENASRAVGRACSRNKLLIVIPCHRVIGKNGKINGFAGGINNKIRLLKLEGNDF